MEGIIKNVNNKGFGFIQLEGYQKDIFFHISEFRGSDFAELKQGDQVSVEEVGTSQKGYVAKGVKLIMI